MKTKILLLALMVASLAAMATHNRAGEITYKRIAPFTKKVGGITVQNYNYLITVVKYTDDGPGIADRCVDTIYFGDNTRGVAARVNGSPGGCGCGLNGGTPIGCGSIIINDNNPPYRVKINIYTIEHTYAGPGNYLIRSFDPNRNQGVINIPNSVNVPFYIESLLVINGFTGANSSPVFTFPPIDRACVGVCFEHDPGAYDPDKDDSLSYEITTSRGANGQTVPGYSWPDYSTGSYGINATTGLLKWCSPTQQGEYNLAFIVKEWRKNTSGTYVLIGYVLRDMQVIVGDCAKNQPPVVTVPVDTCVEAGTFIERKIHVYDPDLKNTVTVLGGGGSFSGAAPLSTLSNTSALMSLAPGGFDAIFRWQTTCDHIRRQPYVNTFKASDDGVPIKLVTFASWNVRVVPPSVKNVTAVPVGSAIRVSWSPPACSPSDNPVTGFKIYRKNDCSTFTPDPCQTGVPSTSGFTLAGSVGTTATSFLDNNNGEGLVVGQQYSYLVVAVYNDGTESFGSAAVCAELRRDVPVMLNVDVMSTSASTGSVYVRWTRPLTTPGNLDTNLYPPPYAFVLKRKNPSGGAIAVFTTTGSTLQSPDTSFVDTGLNTAGLQVSYFVDFVSRTDTVGGSQLASSVLLSGTPADRRINLEWQQRTPWNNYQYTVWRRDPGATQFVQVGTTSLTSFADTSHVVNRYTYCYYVQSEGRYSDDKIYRPLINRSQEACITAKDLTPPCSPTIEVVADCPTGFVHVSWNDVRRICSDDVVSYILSHKATVNDEYVTVNLDTTEFTYDGLELVSGCYAVQAVDSSGNISPRSPDFCIDNCPEFELPNIFTPNGDGNNDHFMAIKVRQIKQIDLNVFDRWGQLVYNTSDPYFKWNGVSQLTKQPVSEGVFFYTCIVFEPRLQGTVKRTLKGTVTVVR